jgi:UDP:flavonoid glycosyltransferase YjiC (YdhE family)
MHVMSDVVVLASPVAAGHVSPLIPLARHLVQSGYAVIWAISGDPDEPAAKWKDQLTALGVEFLDIDAVAPFTRELPVDKPSNTTLMRRLLARTNDVAPAAAKTLAAAVAGRRIVAAVYDFFAIWGYVAFTRLGIARISALISAFPTGAALEDRAFLDDAYYLQELAKLRAAGVGRFDAPLRMSFIPDDPAVHVFAATSKHLCSGAPDFVKLVGVPREVVPPIDDTKISDTDRELVRRLEQARSEGRRVLLLSMGTMVMRFMSRTDPAYVAYLGRLYSTLAAAALKSGAVVIASTNVLSAAELSLDEATLGPDVRERLIALSFVPQPLLFARGLIDVMLMHGGANTFHETIVSAIPVLVSPVFGDQDAVARAVTALGVGLVVETPRFPTFADALSLDQLASETLPAMLAPGESTWKATAKRLAATVREEHGVQTAAAFVLGA